MASRSGEFSKIEKLNRNPTICYEEDAAQGNGQARGGSEGRSPRGNAVWSDDVIDAGDASLVGAWYGKTTAELEPGETLDADVNLDGAVNVQDLALVAGNYGLTSVAAYAGWSP